MRRRNFISLVGGAAAAWRATATTPDERRELATGRIRAGLSTTRTCDCDTALSANRAARPLVYSRSIAAGRPLPGCRGGSESLRARSIVCIGSTVFSTRRPLWAAASVSVMAVVLLSGFEGRARGGGVNTSGVAEE